MSAHAHGSPALGMQIKSYGSRLYPKWAQARSESIAMGIHGYRHLQLQAFMATGIPMPESRTGYPHLCYSLNITQYNQYRPVYIHTSLRDQALSLITSILSRCRIFVMVWLRSLWSIVCCSQYSMTSCPASDLFSFLIVLSVMFREPSYTMSYESYKQSIIPSYHFPFSQSCTHVFCQIMVLYFCPAQGFSYDKRVAFPPVRSAEPCDQDRGKCRTGQRVAQSRSLS